MNVLSNALSLVVVHAKTPALRPNAWATFVFSAMAGVYALLLVYVAGGVFACVPGGYDIEAALAAGVRGVNELMSYVALTCGTEAKTAAWPLFLSRALGLVAVFAGALWLADWIAEFNRYDVIVSGQAGAFPEMLGRRPVDPRADHRGTFRRRLLHFAAQKVGVLAVVAAAAGAGAGVAYGHGPSRDLLLPVDVPCGGGLLWTSDRASEFDCRYRSEFVIFCLFVIGQALELLLLAVLAGSIASDLWLYVRFAAAFPVEAAHEL